MIKIGFAMASQDPETFDKPAKLKSKIVKLVAKAEAKPAEQ